MKEATAKWGMLGKGWGVGVEIISDATVVEPSLVGMLVTIWYKDEDGNKCYGVPILATSQKHFGKRVDDDAFKKATTDGITKGLSYFGFNADVFLGKFDDNKYVQEVTEHFKEPEVVDTVDLSESREVLRKAFADNAKWATESLDWANVDSVDRLSDEEVIELMEKIEGGDS